MVDAEPAVDNSDICRSIVSIDETRIHASAIVESNTVVGYYFNSRMLKTEEEHDIRSRMQSIVRSAAGKIESLSAESGDIAGQMLHSVMHNKKLDLFVFPMPYSGSPNRILAVASKASEDYGSLVRLIQDRLEQMGA